MRIAESYGRRLPREPRSGPFASNGTGNDAARRRSEKSLSLGASDLVLFENLSFQVAKGELLALVGESGAGKSTLLHILGALDSASSGDVYCAQLRLSSLTEEDAAAFRNREIGFVWQFHYLLPEFTAQENVAMPLLLRGNPREGAENEAARWLAR